jgi:uncharacterized protein YigA (DUF484 family)
MEEHINAVIDWLLEHPEYYRRDEALDILNSIKHSLD